MAEYDVNFRGVPLSTAAPGVRLIDVDISAPEIENTMIQPALMSGSIFARQKYASRKITITFAVMENDIAKRHKIISDVCYWASSDYAANMIVPQQPNAHIKVVCSQLPDESTREYWKPLTIVFTATDPFFVSNIAKSADIYNGVEIVVDEYDNPEWSIGQRITGELINPEWSKELQNTSIKFTSLSPGSSSSANLIIKSSNQTATIRGSSVLPRMYIGSRFFNLKHGVNVINTSGGAAGTIEWNERWL